MDEDFREKLLNAKDKDEFLKIIDDMENEKYPDEPKAEVKAAEGYKVLAVTACPTGIAHTYMAAEALEKAGKRLGISIKVETNGSGGAIAVSGATFVAPGGDVPSGFLGAMMSIDMGGPFNKAAYVFGTAAIASGNFDIMAAVMVGGMVPPIAIALATTFFKPTGYL